MIRTIVAGVVVAVALPPCGPALAAPAPGAASRRTELTLSYAADAGYATAVVLRCDPPGGGHPRAARACRVLAKAGGSPSNIRPARRMCLMIYAPITAHVTGVWRGVRVRWSRRFGNACEMTRATGVLFDF